MNTLNVNISELVQKHDSEIKATLSHAAWLHENKNSAPVKVTVAMDGFFRYILDKKLEVMEEALTERVTNNSWANYFSQIRLFSILGSKKDEIIKDYTFADIRENDYYGNRKKLIAFNAENIKSFEEKYLTADEAELSKAIKDFLWYCGATTEPTAYKKKILLRAAKNSTKFELIGTLVKAIAFFNGDLNPTILGDVNQKLRQGLKIDETMELYEGVSIHLRPNLNADMIFSPKNVELLNSKL